MSPNELLALLDRLHAEHEELLPKVLQAATLAERGDPALGAAVDELAETLSAPLEGHIDAEDDVVFPVYADETGARDLVRLFYDEHREILALRDRLLAARAAGGQGRALAPLFLELSDLLSSHMSREEEMLFPSLRELLLRSAATAR